MISIVRGGDMLSSDELLNPGEDFSGIYIASLTSRLNNSRNSLAVTRQVRERFGVDYQSLNGNYPENIGGVFATPEFAFSDHIRGRAFAIVGHDGGDLEDGDYSRAVAGLSQGLVRVNGELFRANGEHTKVALTGIEEYLKGVIDEEVDFKRFLEIEAKLKDVRAKMQPLIRTPLFARESVEDCKLLIEQLNLSPAQIALYIGDNTRELVKATLLKFPGLYRAIPALTDESLELAA